jgi:hypothetical protein
MKISLRGWLLIGTLAAFSAAFIVFGTPLLRAADSSSAVGGQLTEESLGNLLAAMGLEPKKEEHRYDFAFRAMYFGEEWDLTMSTVLSQNGQWVWVMAWLDELPRSAADVPRTSLLRLLADNDTMGTGKFFSYVAGNRRFVLQRALPNDNMTTAGFKEILKDMGASVVETYPHWNVENWKTTASEQIASAKTDSETAQPVGSTTETPAADEKTADFEQTDK